MMHKYTPLLASIVLVLAIIATFFWIDPLSVDRKQNVDTTAELQTKLQYEFYILGRSSGIAAALTLFNQAMKDGEMLTADRLNQYADSLSGINTKFNFRKDGK